MTQVDVYYDFETTSGSHSDPDSHVISIGACTNEQEMEEVFINRIESNYLTVQADAVNVHGITTDILRSKPGAMNRRDAFVTFIEWLRGLGPNVRMFAHSSRGVEEHYLVRELGEEGLDLPENVKILADSSYLAQFDVKAKQLGCTDCKLDSLAVWLHTKNHRHGGLHGALVDAKTLMEVVQKLLKIRDISPKYTDNWESCKDRINRRKTKSTGVNKGKRKAEYNSSSDHEYIKSLEYKIQLLQSENAELRAKLSISI
jgi:DNA polymerase III epsilon subunit-like protein